MLMMLPLTLLMPYRAAADADTCYNITRIPTSALLTMLRFRYADAMIHSERVIAMMPKAPLIRCRYAILFAACHAAIIRRSDISFFAKMPPPLSQMACHTLRCHFARYAFHAAAMLIIFAAAITLRGH